LHESSVVVNYDMIYFPTRLSSDLLTGAILTVRRFSFAYILWTLQGITSVALWFVTALQGHAVWVLMLTYILYLANDMVAFFDSKDRKSKRLNSSHVSISYAVFIL